MDPFVTGPLWLGLKIYEKLMKNDLDQPSKSDINGPVQENPNRLLPARNETTDNQLPETPSDVF